MSLSLQQGLELFLMLILQSLIAALVPVTVGAILILGSRAYGWLKFKLGNERMDGIEAAIRLVVLAAEQSGLTNELLKEGVARKHWAIAEAQRILEERGIQRISVETLSTMIEAAVWDEINQFKDRQSETT